MHVLIFQFLFKLLFALPRPPERRFFATILGILLTAPHPRGAFYIINRRLTPRQCAVLPCCWYTLTDPFE